MYVTIRKYAGCGDLKEVNRVALAELLPVLRTIPGFRSYVIVDTGNGTGASIGMFDNEAAAENANQQARAGGQTEWLPDAASQGGNNHVWSDATTSAADLEPDRLRRDLAR